MSAPKEMLTEEDFLLRWEREIRPLAGDTEGHHVAADDLLISALRHLGWHKLAEKWTESSRGWWWA